MTLIKSISGIRGTIGGKINDNFTPIDIVKFTSAYAKWLLDNNQHKNCKIIVGRDARISGSVVNNLVCSTLSAMGIDVIDLGLSTTPSVEIAVTHFKVDGGIIITASHNPIQWNALKLLNEKGEFISEKDGERILEISEIFDLEYASIDKLGKYEKYEGFEELHSDKILNLELVNKEIVKNKKFKVVIDAVNSTGGIYIPKLLDKLGVDYVKIHCTPNGIFPHNPEPLAENLTDIAQKVVEENADLGIVVDPDVDRLCFIDEKGNIFGEEYTLVAVAKYVLSKKPGTAVSNLSSSKALEDVCISTGNKYEASAVGEVNVVEKMKDYNAIIGGEGNGGIIYPEFHYGRDALVGIALFLTYLAEKNIKCSELKDELPYYEMAKNKIELTPNIDIDKLLSNLKLKYKNNRIIDIDGVKIYFDNKWVHLRKSNTEPIIRVYSEAPNYNEANKLANEITEITENIVNML